MRGPRLSTNHRARRQPVTKEVEVVVHCIGSGWHHTFQKAGCSAVNSQGWRGSSGFMCRRKVEGRTFFYDRCEVGQFVQSGNVRNGPRVGHRLVQFGVEALLNVRATADFPKGVSQSDGSRVHAGDPEITKSEYAFEANFKTHV